MKEFLLATVFAFTNGKKIAWCILLLAMSASHAAVKNSPPNILFIVVDNQPASILGAYGNPDVKTPSIDQLATEGVRYSRAFSIHGMCSPSRATLLTGLLPSRHGVQD
jgi:arylsulfatase A-like enzyme